MAQKGVDLGFSHLGRMGLAAMKLDVTEYPIAVSLFGAVGVMVVAQHLTDLIISFNLGSGLNLGFHTVSY